MKKNSKYIIGLIFLLNAGNIIAQRTGEQIFTSVCAACHSIGKGKIVGPDLSGVNSRYDIKWLTSFIRSSQTMIKSGDPRAVKTFNANNKIPMPDQKLTDAEIKAVLAHIKSKSKPAGTTVMTTTANPNQKQAVNPVNSSSVKNVAREPWVDAEIKINALKVTEAVDPKQLNAPYWNNASPAIITLSPQNVTYPNQQSAAVTKAEVKSIYNNSFVAFRVTWTDSSRNVMVESDQFCDQLAIQLPVDPGAIPSYMMGNQGGKVHIVHWKGIWQEDCENGFRDVQEAYPNMWVDSYTFQEGEMDRSKRTYSKDLTAEHIVESQKVNNMPATYSKNYMSVIKRKEPVEEACAVGFSTLSTQENQRAKGWAKWENNKWTVVILFPVNTGDDCNAKVTTKTKIALAIWDGNLQDIGGRKKYSVWSDLLLK